MRFPFPQPKFAVDVFSELKLQFQQHFSDFYASAKEICILQNPFNCAIEALALNLQLEVINLRCNDMEKTQYQEKNKLFKCPFKQEYAE